MNTLMIAMDAYVKHVRAIVLSSLDVYVNTLETKQVTVECIRGYLVILECL